MGTLSGSATNDIQTIRINLKIHDFRAKERHFPDPISLFLGVLEHFIIVPIGPWMKEKRGYHRDGMTAYAAEMSQFEIVWFITYTKDQHLSRILRIGIC